MTNDRAALATERTEVSAEMLSEERGAMKARADFGGTDRLKKIGLPLLLGAGFVAMVAVGVSGGEDDSLQLQDKDAAKTANEAARAVATDPFGNKPIPVEGPQEGGVDPNLAMGEQPLQPGQEVPAISQSHNQNYDAAAQRREREAREREQLLRERQARQDAIRRAPVMAITSTRGRSSSDANGSYPANYGSQGQQRQATDLESRLNSTSIVTAKAGALSNRNFLVTAGSQIPCVLQTAMDSTLPGFTSCIVPRSVFSDNGRVVLMEKGTRVLGEYQGGLQQGQNRLFVVWNRAITPTGITIALGSPAADALGRSGMSGEVETFFWKRFGGALLLSMVSDLGSAASNRLSGASETSRAPNQAAATALENDIGIQPRLRAPQGTEMTIFVAKDVDFSNVYSLRLKR